ncbi:MAG: Sialic acid TRAP transporter permease protein SiaT [Syntrophorhabdus sp. PtaU1.Bin058]|nr:MAG: Sialic acid TRAP transporter permease protein SiaT [Syntrophorhabdus sp. PtaU1.Bin058]
MSDVNIGLLGLAVLMILFAMGLELALAMFVVGFVGFAYVVNLHAACNLLAKDVFDSFESYTLTVVPLFVLMGQLAYNAGIAKRLYDAAHRFVGHISGGLGIATVTGCAIFGAICGSSAATAATFASVSIPEMDRFGYNRKFSAGLVAISGTLGILIPPSVPMIIYGIITQQSIGRLFMAGIMPGVIIALLFITLIVVRCKVNPAIAPRGKHFGWRERLRSLWGVIWPLLIFVLLMGGLLEGFFTPTEAGSVGTFAILLLSLAKKDLDKKAFIRSVAESLLTATMVLFLLAGSTVLGHFLAVTKIPMFVSEWVVNLPFQPWIIIALICLVYLLGGSFIDDLAFMVLATPIFFPAIVKLGFDPIWFGIMITITVMVGIVLPPVAINVFVVKNVTNTSFKDIYNGVYPFLIGLVGCTILLFIVPQVATFLPNLLYGK